MQAIPRISQKSETFVCAHAGEQVQVSSTVVYPIGLLSSSPPRITKRTCDHLVACHLADKTACPMAVTRV